VSSPTFPNGIAMSSETPATYCTERAPKKLLRYWRRCLRESMLRDPKPGGWVTVECEEIEEGKLPPTVVDRINALLEANRKPNTADSYRNPCNRGLSSSVGQTAAPMAEPERGPVPVLVAPCLLTAVNKRSRSKEGDAIPPFWVPAQLGWRAAARP